MRLGVFPSLDSFRTRASTSSGSYLNQAGGRLLTGLVDPQLPLLPEYSRAKSLGPLFTPRSPVGRYLSRTGKNLPWQQLYPDSR